jgi:hypothetical protein
MHEHEAWRRHGVGIPEGPRSSGSTRRAGIDVLLIDDVRFLAGKESTQDESFHTFR